MNKNTNNSNHEVPEEVLELVPWYATGKLSDEDRAFFDDALVEYPSLQTYLREEMQMIEIVTANKSLLDKSAIAAPEERLKSVFNMIDAEKEIPSESVFDKVKKALNSWLPSNEGVPQYARALSAVAVVVTLAILTAFITPIFTEKSDFVPASATSVPKTETLTAAKVVDTENTVLLIGFNGSSEELGNNAILKDKLLKIESVPNKKGIFQISFKESLSTAEIKQTIDALLLQKDLIWFAGEEF